MNNVKKSFILYSDYEEKLKELSDEEMGHIFRMILHYVNTNEVIPAKKELGYVFSFIKNDLDINLKKWQAKSEKNRIAGSKGGKQKVANANERKQMEEFQADNDIVNDINNSVSVNEKTLSKFYEVIKRHEITNEDTINSLMYYLKEGMSLEVIENGLMLPYNRNVMGFDFELEEAPIGEPIAYGLTILNNWFGFGVKNLADVKKYNKLNKNQKKMLGSI